MRRRADRARTRPVRVAQSRPKPRRADDRVRGEPIAPLAGARTVERSCRRSSLTIAIPGVARPETTDVAASRCRRCSRPAFAPRRTKAIVGDPEGPTRATPREARLQPRPNCVGPGTGCCCRLAIRRTAPPNNRTAGRVPAAGRGRGSVPRTEGRRSVTHRRANQPVRRPKDWPV